jgi:hypothetical protein
MNFKNPAKIVIIAAVALVVVLSVGIALNRAKPPRNSDTVPFTDAEVAAARIVVDKYFAAMNSGKKTDHDAVWTPDRRTMNGDISPYAILSEIEISYSPNDPMRESYITHGGGSIDGTALENVIVFRADFTVTPISGNNAGAWNIGRYTDWSVILVRENTDAEWLVGDNGY